MDRDRLFQESVAKRDSVFIPFSHNFMISQLVRSGDIEGACKVFDEMPEKSPISWTAMVDGLMKCGRVREAMRLYRTCPFRTVCSSTAIISGFVSNELYKEALVFFCELVASALLPNNVTFTCVIKACTESGRFDFAQSILGLVVKTNFENNVSVCNSLITLFLKMGDFSLAKRVFDEMPERDVISWTAALDVYTRMGLLENARELFEQMPERNEVSWSTMIARYDQSGNPVEALRLFKTMLLNEFMPNLSCLSSVLSSCATLGDFTLGCGVHCHALKSGLHDNVFVGSSVIDMYCKCGKSDYGRQVFDSLSIKSVVCWNCMVAGYCSDQKIKEAEKLFDKMPTRNVASWNAIISGYTQNELFVNALQSFYKMLELGQGPNYMTCSTVVIACASIPSLEMGRSIHAKIIKLPIHIDVFLGSALANMYEKSGDIHSCKKVFARIPLENPRSPKAYLRK